MTPGEEFIRTTLGNVGCTMERIEEVLNDVKRSVSEPKTSEGLMNPSCPQCGGPLVEVTQEQNSPFNHEQWRSMIAGDYYCETCPDNNRAKNGKAYFWRSELKTSETAARKEFCRWCQKWVEDWVDPDWAKGRICRACEAKHSPEKASVSLPLPSPAANWHPFVPPFRYEDAAQFIMDAEEHVLLDIRGWGFLTGQGSGGLGLNDVEALALQDEIGRRITALLNGSDLSLLIGLLQLTDREDSKGNWRVIIDYDNYQDGARILDGDGNILGECYDLEKKPNEKFLAAVIEAVSPNLAFARHLQTCQQCGGPDDGCEEGQRLEQAMLSARANRKSRSRS